MCVCVFHYKLILPVTINSALDDRVTYAAFLWTRLEFSIFTRTKTIPKHSRELEISWSQVVNCRKIKRLR